MLAALVLAVLGLGAGAADAEDGSAPPLPPPRPAAAPETPAPTVAAPETPPAEAPPGEALPTGTPPAEARPVEARSVEAPEAQRPAPGPGTPELAGAVVAYTIVDARSIPASLTGAPGDAARGAALYRDPARAGCVACHGLPGAPGPRSAPDLAGVGARLEPGEIRLWLVAPTAIREETAMPAYYAAGQRRAPDDPLYGGPRLTAGEIEDLVAWLAALRDAPAR